MTEQSHSCDLSPLYVTPHVDELYLTDKTKMTANVFRLSSFSVILSVSYINCGYKGVMTFFTSHVIRAQFDNKSQDAFSFVNYKTGKQTG